MKDEISVRVEQVSRCRGLMSTHAGDFGAATDVGTGFSTPLVFEGVISAT
ncbi:MAG: hypothetical protein ACLQFF_11575 [Steroidobacteraceae bacterium]|jgi:hypothetical protein